MKCAICSKEIPRGKRYQGDKYKSVHLCSEECFKKYCEIKTKPKPLVNFKPEKGSNRRIFTDYIQEWTDNKVNWSWLMKQAKDIQEEYDIDWYSMYLVCKYARKYEEVEWDNQYGLGQIFPRYIEPCQEFMNKIKENKNIQIEDDKINVITKKKNYNLKINFN